MPKPKSNSNAEKVMIIVALVAVVLFLMTLKNATRTATAPSGETMAQPTITDTKGLEDATKELNAQDLNQLDSGLNQLDTQTSGF